jgi:hypothetical protein
MKIKSHIVYVTLSFVALQYNILNCQQQNSVGKKAFLEKREAAFQEKKDQYGLTKEKEDGLYAIGIDLRQYQSIKSYPNEVEATIFSDGVVRVKIIGIIDWPGPKEQVYHTKIKALVLESFKGATKVGDTITLLKIGGTVIDPKIAGGAPLQEIVTDGDEKYAVDDEYVVFLNRIARDGYAQGEAKMTGGNLDKYQNDNKCFSAFSSKWAFINKGQVTFRGITSDIDQFEANIQKITKIIGR